MIGGGIVAGSAVVSGAYAKLLAASPVSPAVYDLVAAKGGKLEVMFDKAIASLFDHTCENWVQCYKNSGIEKAVKDAGGKIVSGDSEGYYQKVAVPKGKRLNKAKVHELLLGALVPNLELGNQQIPITGKSLITRLCTFSWHGGPPTN